MINFKKFNSIISLTAYFTSDDKCKQAIVESCWGFGNEQDVVCPYCGKHHCKMSKNGRFHCTECNKNFSCLVGTIFENTKLPIIKWFVAMYLISFHKKGVSSHQLSCDLSVTQSTAWYMLQKIANSSFCYTINCGHRATHFLANLGDFICKFFSNVTVIRLFVKISH